MPEQEKAKEETNAPEKEENAPEKPTEKEEKIRKFALSYYSRKDIQQAIFNFSKQRETIPRYFEGFGTRPDALQYPTEIISAVKKGATSFHTSEELWENPLEIKQEMSPEQYSSIRLGWDMVIDIDSKYLDYSKIAASLIIQALEFSGIKNYGIKFSGSKGFHIIVPWKAFPEQVYDKKTSDMFPEYARTISLYLTELIKPKLIEKVTQLSGNEKSYIKDFEAPEKVLPDIIAVSPRHLFRAPYSLHEKTCLASIVISKNQLSSFQPKDADPLKVEVKNFYPEANENEAKELLISALDWYKHKEKKLDKIKKEYKEIIIDKRKITYPPCVEKIMQGLKDGKKRALFILINYFKSIGFEFDELGELLLDWNKKNNPQLKQGYITTQLDWHRKQKKVLPPNCDKDYYKGIAVCFPDNFCPKIKNPVNYTTKMQFRNNKKSTGN